MRASEINSCIRAAGPEERKEKRPIFITRIWQLLSKEEYKLEQIYIRASSILTEVRFQHVPIQIGRAFHDECI